MLAFLLPFRRRHSLLGHPVPPVDFRPSYHRPTALPAHTRACTADPDEVSTFRTHETRPDRTPSIPREQRCSPAIERSVAVACRLSADWSLPPRRCTPARDVDVTRHLQRFPGSRPLGLPRTCGHHGWSSGPWALPRASHPAGQEPATHVTAGTGRTQPGAMSPASAGPPQLAHSYVRPRVASAIIAAVSQAWLNV